MVYELVVEQQEEQEATEPQRTLEEQQDPAQGLEEQIAEQQEGPDDIDFYPYCVKFIRHDADGWEVAGSGA
uniref:Uncharacterized protein n=1 Tax=Setaria viridis TaxID=4556 RepID=A0A4U6UA36_SETVI|nr:hypothetical protein SEVIR_5G053500v2 [Setaria viridis]